MMRTLVPLVPLALWAPVGCGSSGPGPDDSGAIDRGPRIVEVGGDPNGLWWNDATRSLYIADDNGNRILEWTDEGEISVVADLPSAAPEGAGLGQLVVMPDATIVVTRFGGGTAGDVAFVTPAGEAQVVPGLDVERRRIGLTVTDDGRLFDSWFVRLASGDRLGSVGQLSLGGTEEEVITGLQKPVGVLAVGDELFVSDQDLGQVLRAPLSDPTVYTVHAVVEGPDLVAQGPDGSIFTGSTSGNVYRIDAAGSASVFSSGFQQVRGIAYDPEHRRVFVADHDADESDGETHVLHILPVD